MTELVPAGGQQPEIVAVVLADGRQVPVTDLDTTYRGNPMGPRTDWIMVGESRPSTQDACIIASLSLGGRARIERQVINISEVMQDRRDGNIARVRYSADIAAHANEITEAFAPTYGEALRLLMEYWNFGAKRSIEGKH